MADWNELKKQFESDSQKPIDWMHGEFSKIRTGRANPSIFYDLKVESYGEKLPLNQLSNISSPEPRKITIKPYDSSLIKNIVSEINSRNMGFTPIINGDLIIINVPQPTEETRKLAVKNIKNISEKVKNEVRNIRKKIQTKIKSDNSISEDIVKKQEKDLDILTKDINSRIDSITKTKEKELLEI